MPWVGGVYTRAYPSWSGDASNNLPISATKFDSEDNDFASGLNNCLTKDGLSIPNAPMTWGLSSATLLTLNRGSDGAIFGVGRTGGSNNPTFQISVVDSVGITLNASSSLQLAVGGVAGLSLNSSGNIVISAPSAGIALQVTGIASNWAAYFTGNSTTGASYGLAIQAGTNTSDLALSIVNWNGSVQYFSVLGDGSTYVGAPSGGTFGYGSFNAQSIYINGAAVLTATAAAGTYATPAYVTSALGPYATSAAVTSALTNYVLTSVLTANYLTGSSIAATYAPTTSPNFLGTPTAATAATATNNAQLATTAFAHAVASGTYTTGSGGSSLTLPNGSIIKFGTNSISSAGTTVNFAAATGSAFPTACQGCVCNASSGAATAAVTAYSASGATMVNGINGANSWFAWGS